MVLLFQCKYRCVKLNMLKLAPKTEQDSTFQHKNKNMNFNVMLDNKNTAANYTIAAVLTMYKIFL